MDILAVDDEELALEMLVDTIKEVKPLAEVFSFKKYSEALEFAKNNHCDIAFLDIEMRGKDGIALAKELKEINSKTNIIFVTGYSEYAFEAFSVAASGYVLKPVTTDAVETTLENLRYAVKAKSSHQLFIQCFGNFEVFSEGKILTFSRTKSKELLAYLVNRRGTWCSVREIAATLWEDKQDSETLQGHLRILVADLIKTLEAVGADEILLKKRGMLALQTDCFSCDFYSFIKGELDAINSYTGEYMSQYSWAEFVNAYLDKSN